MSVRIRVLDIMHDFLMYFEDVIQGGECFWEDFFPGGYFPGRIFSREANYIPLFQEDIDCLY